MTVIDISSGFGQTGSVLAAHDPVAQITQATAPSQVTMEEAANDNFDSSNVIPFPGNPDGVIVMFPR